MLKIAVDLDDTLSVVDRVERGGAYIARKGLPYKVVDPDAHVFLNVFDWNEEALAQFIAEGGVSAFIEAETRKGARETLTTWRALGYDVTVLTARGKDWFVNPVNVSRDWLEKRRLPYDAIVAECKEKGRYCAEQGISVLVDDSFEQCAGAQRHGVNAVILVGKNNVARAGEIAFGGSNWYQITDAVEHIAKVRMLEELAAEACPARTRTYADGWALNFDEWNACRGNHVRVKSAWLLPLEEKLRGCEGLYAEKNKPCRFRLTDCDRPLESALSARGYRLEKEAVCMELERIPTLFPNVRTRAVSYEEWLKVFRDITGERALPRSHALIKGNPVYVVLGEGSTPVAAGMGVVQGEYTGVFDLYVDADHRAKGYGGALLERVIFEGKKLGAEKAYLQADARNKGAISLCVKAGFKKVYDYRYRVR